VLFLEITESNILNLLFRLERRFLERVTSTNRVKSSGVNNGSSNNNSNNNASNVTSAAAAAKMKVEDLESTTGIAPPWLRPPNGFKHGNGASMAASHLSSGSNRAVMAGRALLHGNNDGMNKNSMGSGLNKSGSAGLLALMELQQRQGRGGMHSGGLGNSSNSLFAASAASEGKNSGGGDALSQLRSANRLTSGNSMTNLMMKTGLSRDQLGQLVREHRNSSNSLSNMMERQSSLDALMSLDFQSLQSIDNLANLIQTGRGNQVPRSGLKNWQSDSNSSANNLAAVAAQIGSNGNLSNLADARRLQSEGRMEKLIKSLSSGNVRGMNNGGSNNNFNSLLQSMSNNLGGNSNNNLFNSGKSIEALKRSI